MHYFTYYGEGVKKKVLLIDDSIEYLDAMQLLLESSGYEIFRTSQPLQTINLINQHQPHLVILDIMMPETDGLHVLSAIKAQTNHQPEVLIISGKNFAPERKRALALGAAGYLTKPIGASLLLAEIRKVLGD
jgi:DNA-binding response OmpR family regulator